MTILPSLLGGRRPVRAHHLAPAFALAFAAGLVGVGSMAGCYDTNTLECSGGVICPEGATCTADGQ